LEYRIPDVSFGLPDPKMVRFDVPVERIVIYSGLSEAEIRAL
jgi:hypothetical protein